MVPFSSCGRVLNSEPRGVTVLPKVHREHSEPMVMPGDARHAETRQKLRSRRDSTPFNWDVLEPKCKG